MGVLMLGKETGQLLLGGYLVYEGVGCQGLELVGGIVGEGAYGTGTLVVAGV